MFVTILSASISLIAEKDPNAWKLSLNMELMAIGYSVCKKAKALLIIGWIYC
jgi:hypothetical protein